MTLAELAVTIAVLGVLGLAASRFGLSAIPAYLLAGIILGPNEPELIQLVQPSEVTDFVAEIGLIFLLFFLGLEFTLDRLVRSGRHVGSRRRRDFAFNAGLGLARRSRGVRAELRGGRRRSVRLRLLERDRGQGADRLPPSGGRRDRPRARRSSSVEDIVIAAMLGFVATGAGLATTATVSPKALLFVAASLRRVPLARRPDRPAPRATRARVLPPRGVRLRDRDERPRASSSSSPRRSAR